MDLNTIKNNFAQEQGYDDWDDLWHDHINRLLDFEIHMTEICIRAQKAALEKAAENSMMQRKQLYGSDKTTIYQKTFYTGECFYSILLTSITNPENLIR